MTQLDNAWVLGFTDGEGCFFVGINKTKHGLGFQVLPEFVVVQHKRDLQILYALKHFWGVGVVRKNHGERFCYRVRGHQNLKRKILPFFENHSLKTKKKVDFLKFRRIILLMEKKAHLTTQGLLAIDLIASQMNTGKRLRLTSKAGIITTTQPTI